MKTNHLADWQGKRWRDVMWFHLTHTRYGRGSFDTTSQTVERWKQGARTRWNIFFFQYVCRLSITMATATSSSFSTLRTSACVDVPQCFISFRMRANSKHQLPQHRHWAWKHRHTCTGGFENWCRRKGFREFLAAYLQSDSRYVGVFHFDIRLVSMRKLVFWVGWRR